MFKLSSVCGGWADIPRGSPSQTPTNAATFWGQRMRSGKIVRAYRSALHYTTISENELGGDVLHGTNEEPDEVNAETLARFVNAGVNILAPDGLDGETIEAMVWSWAPHEPQPAALAAAISARDGRWYGVVDVTRVAYSVCVSRTSAAVSWRVIGRGQSCPSGFSSDVPRSGLENTLLRQTLTSVGGDAAMALLPVEVRNLPSISAADQAQFDGNATPPVTTIAPVPVVVQTPVPGPVSAPPRPDPEDNDKHNAWSRFTPQELFAMIQGIFASVEQDDTNP
ncbi:hypothetical protein PINS_up015328 [Pythium insidiosum]|nr:hypothetical protein PINS_up015328 [Pythium insidiosum]